MKWFNKYKTHHLFYGRGFKLRLTKAFDLVDENYWKIYLIYRFEYRLNIVFLKDQSLAPVDKYWLYLYANGVFISDLNLNLK